MKRFFNVLAPAKELTRQRKIFLVERTLWQDGPEGMEAIAVSESPFFYSGYAVNAFFEEVAGLDLFENVYKERVEFRDGFEPTDVIVVYGGLETVSIPLWDDCAEMLAIRYRAVRGKTVFTCGTEEEVFNYLKGATGKELDPDTFVIDRTEFVKNYFGKIVGAKFYFHYDGTEGVEAYVEIYDPRPKDEPVILYGPDEIPEQMPF